MAELPGKFRSQVRLKIGTYLAANSPFALHDLSWFETHRTTTDVVVLTGANIQALMSHVHAAVVRNRLRIVRWPARTGYALGEFEGDLGRRGGTHSLQPRACMLPLRGQLRTELRP